MIRSGEVNKRWSLSLYVPFIWYIISIVLILIGQVQTKSPKGMRERRGYGSENGGESPPSLLSPKRTSSSGSSSGDSNDTEPLFSDRGSPRVNEEVRNLSGVSWEVIQIDEAVWRAGGTEAWERVSEQGKEVKKNV